MASERQTPLFVFAKERALKMVDARKSGVHPRRQRKETARKYWRGEDEKASLVGPVGAVLGLGAGLAFFGAAFGTLSALVGGVIGLAWGVSRELRARN